jgi:hypothetical protein
MTRKSNKISRCWICETCYDFRYFLYVYLGPLDYCYNSPNPSSKMTCHPRIKHKEEGNDHATMHKNHTSCFNGRRHD